MRFFAMGANAGIRFFAPGSWRGRLKSAEARRLLAQYRGTGLAPDPGPGPFQAKVLLNGERVRWLAGASGRDVSSFLRCLFAPRMPLAPVRKPPVVAPRAAPAPPPRPTAVPRFRPAASEYAIPNQTSPQAPGSSPRPNDERKIVPGFCSQCGTWRDGIMAGVPARFRCLTCGGS